MHSLKPLPLLIAALLVSPAWRAGAAEEAAAPEFVDAIWKDHVLDFSYIARTVYYTCDGLERKVEDILEGLGARDDLRVRALGCSSMLSPERFVRLRLTLALPVPAAEGESESQEERSRRELVARVRGDEAVDPNAEHFPAEWRTVKIDRRLRYLDDADCELVEQLERTVFPKLGIETTEDDNWCIPGHTNFGQTELEVRALIRAPTPDEKAETDARSRRRR